jgi:hypothetical protein
MASPYCSVSLFCVCVCVCRPPLWSSGQSSQLQIQRSRFDSRLYQIFWEVVGLQRGALSLVSTIEELLERKSSGSGLENWEYGRRDPSRWLRDTLYPQKLALTSPTSGCHLVRIVRLRAQTTEFVFCLCVCVCVCVCVCMCACMHTLKGSTECISLLYTN